MDNKDFKKALNKKNIHLIFHWTEPEDKKKGKGYINTIGSINFINKKGEDDSIGFRLPAEEIAKGLSETLVKLSEQATKLYNDQMKEIKKLEKKKKDEKKTTKSKANRATKKSV